MDRILVQPGAVPLDTDLLNVQRWAMIQTGYLAQAMLGTGTIVDGLALNPTAPASLTVTIGPGAIYQLATIDANDFGSLSADNASPLVKVGVNAVGSTSFTLTAPSSSGQSINYLIEASLQESDSVPLVLPYFNPSNPAQPYSGPNNTGATVNTQRVQRVQLQLKAGAAANTGSQTTPSVDNGWVGLYVITVNFGQSQITSGNLTGAKLATAPFIPAKLGPGMLPGFSNIAVYTSNNTFTVPNGVTKVKARVWGAGGGGGGSSGTANSVASAGGAGGYAEGVFSVTPGQTITVTVPAGASGGTGGGSPASGGNGGTASFGALVSATGGSGGTAANGAIQTSAGAGGAGTGGALNISGQGGGIGYAIGSSFIAAQGGGTFGTPPTSPSASGVAIVGANGAFPGGGGMGGVLSGAGGNGGGALVIVEY
jgi:hypothetical protein